MYRQTRNTDAKEAASDSATNGSNWGMLAATNITVDFGDLADAALASYRFRGGIAEYDAQPIERIIYYILESYESGFSLSRISEMANMNKFDLIRKFKNRTGTTPYAFCMDIRMRKALELLEDPKHRIIDVGVLCGFENHSHFTRVFRQKIGVPPSVYRNRRLSNGHSREGP